MVVFELINDKDVWNTEIQKFDNYNPYQQYGWGQYKKKLGWQTASIKANDNGNIAYLQITYKKKLNIFFGWCIGSIAGKLGAFYKDDLIKFLNKTFHTRYVFIKSNFTNKLNFEESITLYTSMWSKSLKKISSDYTIYVNLNDDFEKLLASCSSNFKRNVKRGYAKNIDIDINSLSEYDERDIFQLFTRFKKIKDVLLPNLKELKTIKTYLSNNIFVATSQIANEVVGLRAFLYLGYKAIDFWAATDDVGRNNYTSYVLLVESLKKAKELGITEYDMSGIDPVNNSSVYNFKNGLRAKKVEKLGEWEMSNSKFLSFLINKVYL